MIKKIKDTAAHAENLKSKETAFLQIYFKRDIIRLFNASENLKGLKKKLDNLSVIKEIDQIIKDIDTPDDLTFLQINFKKDIEKILNAQQKLINLKDKVAPSFFDEIDMIVKDIR